MTAPARHSGRCYCGATSFEIAQDPLIVAMCHCADCRRWTGAASPVFVAFPRLALTPDLGKPFVASSGVARWHCQTCHSPIAATFPYLPDQVYVAVGALDHPETYKPDLQCFANERLSWVHVDPSLPEAADSGQDVLNAATGERP